jgi:hypothetical protein
MASSGYIAPNEKPQGHSLAFAVELGNVGTWPRQPHDEMKTQGKCGQTAKRSGLAANHGCRESIANIDSHENLPLLALKMICF